MAESDVLAQVKVKTGAEDAQVSRKVTDWVWSVLVAHPDGPDAYKFTTHLVDVEGPEIRILGFGY
jgi:hypothetical protein